MGNAQPIGTPSCISCLTSCFTKVNGNSSAKLPMKKIDELRGLFVMVDVSFRNGMMKEAQAAKDRALELAGRLLADAGQDGRDALVNAIDTMARMHCKGASYKFLTSE